MGFWGSALKAPFTDAYSSYSAPFKAGFSPHIGGALVGAGAGAMIGGVIPGQEAGTGAAIGAGVGALALPAIGLAGVGAMKLGGAAVNNAGAISSGLLNAGASIGKGVGKGVGTLAASALTVPDMPINIGGKNLGNAGKLFSPVQRHAGAIKNVASNLIKYQHGTEKFNPSTKQLETTRGRFKISGLGWGALGIGAVAAGAKSLYDDMENKRAGTPTGVVRATPNYMNNAGASGDLVFALNANRRG